MTRRLLPVACTLAALALLGACAQPAQPGQPGQPVPLVADGRADAGAGAGLGGTDSAGEWDGFPVDRVPRPIVAQSGALMNVFGFRSGAAKIAFETGRIELATKLPEMPATVAVDLTDGRFTVPALPPDEAFASVRAQGSPDNAPGENPAPIRFTSVTLGSAEFGTDRGQLRLPAWLFGGPDLLSPVAWPAVGKEAFWRYGEPNNAAPISPAQLSRDGRRISYSVPGQDCPNLPPVRYWVEVTETPTTVVLTTVGEVVSTTVPDAPGNGCPAVLPKPVPYDVDLAAPLGNRVLITRRAGTIR